MSARSSLAYIHLSVVIGRQWLINTPTCLLLAPLAFTGGRAYFKQDLQLHETWQWANWHCNNCTFYTAHFDFTTAQIAINCTL